MEKIELNQDFWSGRYQNHTTGWDTGAITTPLKSYFEQLENKDLKILIPGAGNSYEAEYLFLNGFTNVWVVDIAPEPLENLKKRCPKFPEKQLLQQDFFEIEENFDLIVEQTFFCAIDPKLRRKYAEKIHQLLNEKGKLVGLLWDNVLLDRVMPPFGGTREEYKTYFDELFKYKYFEKSHNSIKPRENNELFMVLVKK